MDAPSKGRIVFYRSPLDAEPWPALVLRSRPDRPQALDLRVESIYGSRTCFAVVPQDETTIEHQGYWYWPPRAQPAPAPAPDPAPKPEPGLVPHG